MLLKVARQRMEIAEGALGGDKPEVHEPAGRRSINTSNVQAGPPSSNQRCSEPSIWTSSPRASRRSPGWCSTRRCLRDSHNPSAIIHLRKVSCEIWMSCNSASFSAAKVGLKSANCNRIRSRTWARHATPMALFGARPRALWASPDGPSARNRVSSRNTCRGDRPSRPAASSTRKRPVSTSDSTSIGFNSRSLIANQPMPVPRGSCSNRGRVTFLLCSAVTF